MKCVAHIQREAESYCYFCKQPICGKCRDYLGACIYCAENTTKDVNREYVWTIILSICMTILGLYLEISEEGLFFIIVDNIIVRLLITAICWAGVPFGWRAINRITPDIFLILPLVGWVIFFCIKFIISFFIGWIVAIPKCISMYKNIKINSKVMKNVKIIKKDLREGKVF